MTILAAGQLIAHRYELTNRIAIGGMGEVWEACDTRLGRAVAVKILRPELSGDDEFRHRFRIEAQTVASLDHVGIAHVHDYGEEIDGPRRTAYLVMELVRGEPLSTIVARGPLPPEDTLRVVEQAAWALHAAHERGFVHRDVKPGNILVGEDGRVKLTDFGIAKAANAAPVTRSGMVMGTAHYIAPEQATGGEAGPTGDVYSLGIVTYECLAGHRPFRGESAVDVAAMQVRDAPPPLPPAIPANVRALVDAVLVKDPAQRYRSGREFAEAVAAVRRGEPAPRPSGVFDVVARGAGAGGGRRRRRRSRTADEPAAPGTPPRSPQLGSPVQPPAEPQVLGRAPAPPGLEGAPSGGGRPSAARPSTDSGTHRTVEPGARSGSYPASGSGGHRAAEPSPGLDARPAADSRATHSRATGTGAHRAAVEHRLDDPSGQHARHAAASPLPDSPSGAHRAALPPDAAQGGPHRPAEASGSYDIAQPAHPTVRSPRPQDRSGRRDLVTVRTPPPEGRRARTARGAPLENRSRSSVGRVFLLILFVLLTLAAVVVGGLILLGGLDRDGVFAANATSNHPATAAVTGSVTSREGLLAGRAADGAPFVAVSARRDVR